MTSESSADAAGGVPFQAHVDLLCAFLAHRDAIAAKIEGLLNAQRRPPEYLRDRRLLSRHFEDCFFALAGVAPSLRGKLEEAHWARGFKPRAIPGMDNDLVDPGEMMVRAFHLWSRTRWPGSSGRARYAHMLFDLYVVRQLALLCMRAWDGGPRAAGERLARAQRVLDELWAGKRADQPALVRDVRWLIPVAQSPGTDELAPYFRVAEQIAETAAEDDRIRIHDAVVRLAGGHLRSYLHYYVTQKGAALDDAALVVLSRKSNALDYSLLIQALVPLLEAYERAVQGGDSAERLRLADAICQGISPDPELFVNRVDLLAAYSMVEYLFVTTGGGGHAEYTATGRRHVRLLDDYAARIARLAAPLHEDCAQFQPVVGAYSPYGALYGVAANILEHMVLKTVQLDADPRFSLEDVFTRGGADKVAWMNGWRKLPHVDAEVQELYAYPQRFAEQIFARVEQALRARAANEVPATGRLFLVPESSPESQQLAARYVLSSDDALVSAQNARAYDQVELLDDRLEGHFLAVYETRGGWAAVTKDLLTAALAAGQDLQLAGLPTAAAETLRLTCRHLAVVPHMTAV